MTSRREWHDRTGDAAFVDRVLAVVGRLTPAAEAALDAGRPVGEATVPGLGAAVISLGTLAEGCTAQAAKLDAKAQPDAHARMAAKAALVGEVAAALQALTRDDADADDDSDDLGAQVGTYIGWIGDCLTAAPAIPDAARRAEEAEQAATSLAGQLAAMDPAARQLAMQAKWPANGLVRVLEKLPEARRSSMAREIVSAAGEDRAYAHALCVAALRRAVEQAEEPGAVLPPGGVASALMAAYNAGGPAGAYARSAAELARGTDGPAVQPLASALIHMPLPADVSRLAAALHDETLRFGPGAAQALARGYLALRVIAPALEEAAENGEPALAEVAALLRTVSNGGPELEARPDLQAASAALDRFTDQAVAAGQAAELVAADGEDPDDLVIQRGAALRDEFTLADTFAEPTPGDPLGTTPAILVTRLGQAILQARQQRATDYDWAAVAALQDEDPDGFAALVEDERCEVLDLIPLPPGDEVSA